MSRRRHRGAVPLILIVALGLSGCGLIPTPQIEIPSATPTGAVPEAESTPSAEETDLFDAEVFAERDAFFVDQQQTPGDDLLIARTPAQQEFISQQRAYVESQGVTWTPELESITLALALDACETSILNSHQVDENVFASHVASSPLISALSQGDPAAEQGAVSIMVFGTGFVCPDDAPQWEAAWQASAGG